MLAFRKGFNGLMSLSVWLLSCIGGSFGMEREKGTGIDFCAPRDQIKGWLRAMI